jgi:hypothetical protein
MPEPFRIAGQRSGENVIQVFAPLNINQVRTSGVKKWPASIEAIAFQINDSEWTQPNSSFSLYMRLSWQVEQPTGNEPLGSAVWSQDGVTPYIDGPNTWTCSPTGVPPKDRGGNPVGVILGPFTEGVDEQGQPIYNNPRWVQFRAVPVSGVARVGLNADVEDLA